MGHRITHGKSSSLTVRELKPYLKKLRGRVILDSPKDARLTLSGQPARLHDPAREARAECDRLVYEADPNLNLASAIFTLCSWMSTFSSDIARRSSKVRMAE